MFSAMLIKAFCKAIRKLKASLEICEVVVHGMFLQNIRLDVIGDIDEKGVMRELVKKVLVYLSRKITKSTKFDAC